MSLHGVGVGSMLILVKKFRVKQILVQKNQGPQKYWVQTFGQNWVSNRYGQMLPGQMLPGQMLPGQMSL